MGWLRLVGSLKLQVSFAEYSLFYRALLQQRPIIWRGLLIVATPSYVLCILLGVSHTSPLRWQVSFAKEPYTQCASLGNTWGVLCITRQFAMETYHTRMSCVLYVSIANFIVNFAMMTTRNRWCILCWRVTGCCKRAHIVNVAVSFLDIANFLA